MWDGDTRACEVRGFDWALRTTADELEGKWGNDLVRLTEVRMINEPPEMMTGEELIEFFTNDDNFEKTTHEIPYSQIIICRTQEELQEHYLGSGR